MSSIYYYGQDGTPVTDELIKLFDLGPKEYRYSDCQGKNIFDFVGFVFKKGNILAVFPKHYFKDTDINIANKNHMELQSDIKLLFNVIQRYREKEKTTATVKSYIGAQDKYESDYPFRSFFEIYTYFKKYGLYKEQEDRIVQGSKGKISWKTTLSKSNKIISNGNLIFTPLYMKKRNYNNVFITECMAFIINYTIDSFRAFFNLKKAEYKYKFDFINNKEYVLQQLKSRQNNEFKDINKKLIINMIDFFEQYDHKSNGGNAHIRIRYFDMIWQKMMALYMNKHFVDIDSVTGAVIFDKNQYKSPITFNDTTFNDIDLSHHHFSIDIDHIAFDNNRLFIFDSKYYSKINELNYKQLSYNEILRYHYPGVTEIHNILFLPGDYSCNKHFSYGPNYIGPRKIGSQIIEQYVNIKDVMVDYLL
ncbi:hypothetical protein [Longibaculum muris]|uniref:hypothetical protein n=1 Tax=Longibaculum muris TaxID=1796628 RepID=UPI002943B9B5|nr:hypothetical protein [Longibaculum muris]